MKWLSGFIDKVRGRGPDRDDGSDPVGPRRRQSARYAYETRLRARCSSWERAVELLTGDVSEGGLFVPTTEAATVGEMIELDLTLPDGQAMQLVGRVVCHIDAAQAERLGRGEGLGIQIERLTGATRERFLELVDAARSGQPIPADMIPDGVPVPQAPPAWVGSPEDEPSRVGDVSDADDLVVDVSEDDDIDTDVRDGLEEPKLDPPGFQGAGHHAVLAPPRAAPLPPPPVAPPAPPPPQSGAPMPTPAVAPASRGGPAPKGALRTAAVAPGVSNGIYVGIDLGTTYSSVAAVQGNRVAILKQPDGASQIPSVIAFPQPGQIVLGAAAKSRVIQDPKHTITSPKRLLGRQYDDPEVQPFLGQAAYPTSRGPDGSILIEMWDDLYAIPQLCSYLLAQVRDQAQAQLGAEIAGAVITVPTSFDGDRLAALRRACQMARLPLLTVIDEPSAAALSNRFLPGFGGTVGVYDFGGGTFDFSVVDVAAGDFKVMATAGDTWLGGDDFDDALAQAVANQFWRVHQTDLRNNQVEYTRLLYACEHAKRVLTLEHEAVIAVPAIHRTAQGMVDLRMKVNRASAEKAWAPVIERSLTTCVEALEMLGMQPSDLSAIFLSGGTTYIPAVRQAVIDRFRIPVKTGVPPEHAVCLGAAIHAAQLQYQAPTVLDPMAG